MSGPRFIFNTLDYQNGANTFNNYVNNVNAVNNAPATGNSFKFLTNADRMKYLLGSKGQSRNSGYYSGLYLSLYKITVTNPDFPAITGPNGTGWGPLLWSGPTTAAINISDDFLTQKTGNGDYVGVQYAGYIYSPVASTITFQLLSDDGVALYFNNTLVSSVPAWDYHGPTEYTITATINAGYNPIKLLFFEGTVTCIFRFSYHIGTDPTPRDLTCDCFYNYQQM